MSVKTKKEVTKTRQSTWKNWTVKAVANVQNITWDSVCVSLNPSYIPARLSSEASPLSSFLPLLTQYMLSTDSKERWKNDMHSGIIYIVIKIDKSLNFIIMLFTQKTYYPKIIVVQMAPWRFHSYAPTKCTSYCTLPQSQSFYFNFNHQRAYPGYFQKAEQKILRRHRTT